MNKIIGNLKPLNAYQTFFVCSDNNLTEQVKVETGKISDTILNLTKKFGINDVDLYGSKDYVEGIIKSTKEKEINMFNKNILNIQRV